MLHFKLKLVGMSDTKWHCSFSFLDDMFFFPFKNMLNVNPVRQNNLYIFCILMNTSIEIAKLVKQFITTELWHTLKE